MLRLAKTDPALFLQMHTLPILIDEVQYAPELMSHQKDILIVKDFSRFSRRNSRGLVKLEDLRDAGVRIISIGENVDFPNDDDWLKIHFTFMVNEMPATDTSKKVKAVIKRRQQDGKWIRAAPTATS